MLLLEKNRGKRKKNDEKFCLKFDKGPFIIYDGGWAGKKRGWVMRYFLVKGGGT